MGSLGRGVEGPGVHGQDVGEYLLDRVQAMMDGGDEDGLAHWMMIAAKVKQRQEPGEWRKVN